MSVVCGCGAENPAGHRFCGQCGASLARLCEACGAAAAAEQRFCGECGAPLQRTAPAEQAVPQTQTPETVPELRWASMLFVDLVGSTSMAESRGPDEVRDLLSGYFDAARLIIDRHGGVVEKFIGDAVMAVWGATAAREDDAERAVRAALEIVTAVQAYGEEAGVPALRARAGVVTGQVAGWSTAGDGLEV